MVTLWIEPINRLISILMTQHADVGAEGRAGAVRSSIYGRIEHGRVARFSACLGTDHFAEFEDNGADGVRLLVQPLAGRETLLGAGGSLLRRLFHLGQ